MCAASVTRETVEVEYRSSENSGKNRLSWNAAAIFAVSAVFHVGVVLIVHQYSNGVHLYPDARRYDGQSTLMAFVWHAKGRTDVHGLERIAGSAFWGYPALMALCKVLTGGGWLAAKTVLSLISATGAVAAYALATTSGRGRKRATAVGLIVGTSPSLLLWDAWGLKDGLITSLLLWSLLLIVRTRFTIACLAGLAGIQLCTYLRAAAAVFIAAALIARIRLRRGYLVGLAVTATAVLVFIVPRAGVLFGLVDALEVGKGISFEFSGGYGSRNLLSNPQYISHFLFGPFPWAFGANTATPERWLYIGTVIWIVSLVLAPSAIKKAWGDTAGAGRTMVLASAAYAAVYLLGFGAEFYRQRSAVECMTMILIVLYSPLSPAVAVDRVLKWLAVVAGLAIMQSPYLAPTVWSKWLAFGAMCLMAFVAAVPDGFGLSRRGSPRRRQRRGSGGGRRSNEVVVGQPEC
ncbi:hypothetical protein [Streptomyces sp. NPDC004589]|uniref:hypothetical protein n=1 Tax=Streptomyces sp. NPDC004589 TaxID=3154553 RepID=UPI0033A81824